MSGAFTREPDFRRSTVPPDRMIEAVPRLDVYKLPVLAGEKAEVILSGNTRLSLTRGVGFFQIGDAQISLAVDEPMADVSRYWFQCPKCQRRCRFLFLRDVFAC